MCGDTAFSIPARSTCRRRIFQAPMRRQRLAARVEEENALPARRSLQPRTQLADVRRDGADRRASDRDESLLASLAEHAHELVLEQDVRTPSVIHSETRSPAPYASSSIARSRNTSGSSSVGAASSRSTSATVRTSGSVRQRFGVSSRSLGSRATAPSAKQEAKVGADRRDVAPDRRRREADVLQVIDELAEDAARDVDRRRSRPSRARTSTSRSDVAAIGLERARRRPLLERQEVVEAVELKAKHRALVQHRPLTTPRTRSSRRRCRRCLRRGRSSPCLRSSFPSRSRRRRVDAERRGQTRRASARGATRSRGFSATIATSTCCTRQPSAANARHGGAQHLDRVACPCSPDRDRRTSRRCRPPPRRRGSRR